MWARSAALFPAGRRSHFLLGELLAQTKDQVVHEDVVDGPWVDLIWEYARHAAYRQDGEALTVPAAAGSRARYQRALAAPDWA